MFKKKNLNFDYVQSCTLKELFTVGTQGTQLRDKGDFSIVGKPSFTPCVTILGALCSEEPGMEIRAKPAQMWTFGVTTTLLVRLFHLLQSWCLCHWRVFKTFCTFSSSILKQIPSLRESELCCQLASVLWNLYLNRLRLKRTYRQRYNIILCISHRVKRIAQNCQFFGPSPPQIGSSRITSSGAPSTTPP